LKACARKNILRNNYVKVIFLSMVSIYVLYAAQKCLASVDTQGNLSVGKFYKYSVAPSATYPDSYPVTNYSDGSKLTNEVIDSTSSAEWVGWQDTQGLEIMLDLGKIRPINEIKIQALSKTSSGISFPASVLIFTRQNISDDWVQYGSVISSPSNTDSLSFQWVGHNGIDVLGRHVKFVANAAVGQWMVFEELIVNGTIHNAWRYVPAYGCYHGAFPKDENGYLAIDDFETLAKKQLSVVLWYNSMGGPNSPDPNFIKIGQLYSSQFLGQNYFTGYRYLSSGWLPYYTTASQITQGIFDDYYKTWFADSINPALRNGCTDPIWIRPMNEMNGSWTFHDGTANLRYGGDPINYRRAWRRMYNIAEQIGATDLHLFVWAPSTVSVPDEPWNHMANYYPGDQYVDWVGQSVYPWYGMYPIEIMSELYGLYGNHKPIMIAEGGFGSGVDRVQYIHEMYECPKTVYPNLKLIIYENHGSRVIDYSEATLAAYQESVADPFFLAKTNTGRVDLNYDGIVNMVDVAFFAQQWLFSGLPLWQENFAGIEGLISVTPQWTPTTASTIDAWTASDTYWQDGPAAKASGVPLSGKSDLYSIFQISDDYTLSGSLIDYIGTDPLSTERSTYTRVYIEAKVDTSGNIIDSGWAFDFLRVHSGGTNWYDAIVIRDRTGAKASEQIRLGKPGPVAVPFKFIRQGNNVTFLFGQINYVTTDVYDSSRNCVRIWQWGLGSSSLLGNTNEFGVAKLKILSNDVANLISDVDQDQAVGCSDLSILCQHWLDD
jgi:hypothetical protein